MSKTEELEQLANETYIFVGIVFLIHMAFKIHESYEKGGINHTIKEIMENLFLWFLLLGVVSNMLGSDEGDEMDVALFSVAFGICRIAKHMARKIEATKVEKS